jgi:hypothetical protein
MDRTPLLIRFGMLFSGTPARLAGMIALAVLFKIAGIEAPADWNGR